MRPGHPSPSPGEAPASPPRFHRRLEGRCWLCGDPAQDLFCVAHAWADAIPVPVQLSLNSLHGYWLDRHSALEIRELAQELDR